MSGSKRTEIVTSQSWIKDELLDHYLSAKYSNNSAVLTISSVSVDKINQADKIKELHDNAIGSAKKAELEHVFIPFMIKNPIHANGKSEDDDLVSRHFALIYIAMEDGVAMDATWLDSKGSVMPDEVKQAIKAINSNITIRKQGINFVQQDNSYDCAPYVAKNIASIIAGKQFTAFGAGEAISMRRDFCTQANTVAQNTEYQFCAQQLKIVGNDENTWSSDDFVFTASEDVMKALKNGEKSFETAFKLASTAYKSAETSLADNPHSFFNEYNKFKEQLDTELAKVSSVDFKPSR